MLEVLDAFDMTVCNAWFKKDEDDLKVIKSEVCVPQHYLVVADVIL